MIRQRRPASEWTPVGRRSELGCGRGEEKILRGSSDIPEMEPNRFRAAGLSSGGRTGDRARIWPTENDSISLIGLEPLDLHDARPDLGDIGAGSGGVGGGSR